MQRLLIIGILISTHAYSQEPVPFGGSGHDEFPGRLTCSEFDLDSTSGGELTPEAIKVGQYPAQNKHAETGQ